MNERRWPVDRRTDPIRRTRQTRIRVLDEAGETLGIIWTHPDADDEHIRSLIPDGHRAMVARNVWTP